MQPLNVVTIKVTLLLVIDTYTLLFIDLMYTSQVCDKNNISINDPKEGTDKDKTQTGHNAKKLDTCFYP